MLAAFHRLFKVDGWPLTVQLDGSVGFDALHLGQQRGGKIFDFLEKLVL